VALASPQKSVRGRVCPPSRARFLWFSDQLVHDPSRDLTASRKQCSIEARGVPNRVMGVFPSPNKNQYHIH
jgi:hypothetical protein